jgi:hypothetical protein
MNLLKEQSYNHQEDTNPVFQFKGQFVNNIVIQLFVHFQVYVPILFQVYAS